MTALLNNSNLSNSKLTVVADRNWRAIANPIGRLPGVFLTELYVAPISRLALATVAFTPISRFGVSHGCLKFF